VASIVAAEAYSWRPNESRQTISVGTGVSARDRAAIATGAAAGSPRACHPSGSSYTYQAASAGCPASGAKRASASPARPADSSVSARAIPTPAPRA
jgi:hypothetical protein